MKKLLILPLFFLCAYALQAQIFVEGVKLTPDNTGRYLELDPMFKTDGRCAFQVDYGQNNPKEDYLTDENGKRYDFRSLIDGLNFFYANGWEVNQVTTLEHSGRKFLLTRRY